MFRVLMIENFNQLFFQALGWQKYIQNNSKREMAYPFLNGKFWHTNFRKRKAEWNNLLVSVLVKLKERILIPIKSRVRHFSCELSNAIIRQPIERESCSNPLRIGKVLQLRLNLFFILDPWLFVGDVEMGGCFCAFLAEVNWHLNTGYLNVWDTFA